MDEEERDLVKGDFGKAPNIQVEDTFPNRKDKYLACSV
jgi:hypothetical protein